MYVIAYRVPNINHVKVYRLPDATREDAKRFVASLPEDQGTLTVESLEDLAKSSHKLMVKLFNELTGGTLQKFETTAIGAGRLWKEVAKVAENATVPGVSTPEPAEGEPAPILPANTDPSTVETPSTSPTSDVAAEPSAETTQQTEGEQDMAKKTKKAKTERTPRQNKKPAKKVSEFRQVREGTARAKVLEQLASGKRTVAQIAGSLGLTTAQISTHMFCLWRDCGIGHDTDEKGIVSVIFPGEKSLKDALKAPTEKKAKKAKA